MEDAGAIGLIVLPFPWGRARATLVEGASQRPGRGQGTQLNAGAGYPTRISTHETQRSRDAETRRDETGMVGSMTRKPARGDMKRG